MSRKLKEKERLARRDIEKFRHQLLKTHMVNASGLLELQRACDRLLPIIEYENTRVLDKPITDGLRGERTLEGMIKLEIPLPTFLYHGTSETAAARILTDGIVPRGDRPANHPAVPSHHDRAYLTDCYALRYVMDNDELEGRGAVLEVELEPLRLNLVADEDAIPPHIDRDNEHSEAGIYFLLYKYGTVAHMGTIPVSSIRRVVYIPTNSTLWPTVTSWTDGTNHSTVRIQQSAILRWVFDGENNPFPVPFEELVFNRDLIEATTAIPARSEEQAQNLLSQGVRADTLWRMHFMMLGAVLNRQGIEVVSVSQVPKNVNVRFGAAGA